MSNVFSTQRLAGGWVFGNQFYIPVVVATPVMQGALEAYGVAVWRFSVRWPAATVNLGTIAGYEISLNNGAFQRIGPVQEYTFNWMRPATDHLVAVRAYDGANNYSAPLSLVVTTLPFPAVAKRQVLVNGRLGMDPQDVARVVIIPRS